MWHAVGSSPLNRFSMSVVRFRQLRAGQGTEGSRDCRASIASAYGETALQTVFANAPSHSGNKLSFANSYVMGETHLYSWLQVAYPKAQSPLRPLIAQLPTHQPRCSHPQWYSRHCHINLHTQSAHIFIIGFIDPPENVARSWL